jgi:TonB-linked SusC/RagA family outer membrane protein
MKINLLLLRKFCIRHVCIFLLILISLQVSARISETEGKSTFASMQQTSITGTVTDNTGKPVPGVTVLLKGTTNGVITDNNGKYTLYNVESSSVISFSFVGMVTVETIVGNQKVIDIVLKDDSFALEEVVAVGYATQRRATLTGSVASVRNEELVVTKNENVANMLTGKLPGVRVVQKSSAPGDYNTVIDIRGMGTPLFVVDGVTRDQAYFVRMDPLEIESISVLKDGSAAIYGLRAANGVILITTKSGTSKDGKVDITYSGNFSAQQFLSVPDGVNAQDYMTLRNEQTWQNFNNNYLVRQNPIFTQADMQPYIDGKPSYNWMDAVFNKSTPQHQHNISIDGGSDKLRYFMSLAYAHQEGSYKSGDFTDDKWNFRSTVDAQITSRLKAKATLGAILDTRTSPTGAGWDFYKAAWLMRPDAPIYANDNPLYLNGDASVLFDGRNMVAQQMIDNVGYDIRNTRRLNGTLSLNYDIPGIKGLSARGSYDYAMSLPDNTTYRSTYPLYIYNPATDVYTPSIKNSPANVTRSANFNFDTDLQLGLHYNSRFDKHSVNSFLIFQEAYSKWDGFSAYRELLIASEYLFAGEDLNQRAMGGLPGDRLSQSLIGSLTYDFSEKYMVDFKFRYDGSSRFPKGSRWGFFPSVSAGWRISEESFMKDNLPFISNMKLRASYGEMGDDGAASNYPPTLGFSLSNNVSWVYNNVLNGGVVPQAIPNPNLTWYEIKMYNIAMDFGLLRNKINGTFELYRRDRSGLLATSAAVVPGTVGASLPQENLNSDRNFGWELSLNYRNQIRDFSYWLGGQISGTRSMRTDWLEGIANNQYHHWRNRTSGRYNNIWWGNESNHMFTSLEEIRNYKLPMGQGSTPGDWILNDWNEDGVIDGNDDHPIATNGLPLFNYGINMGASWKKFDMVALFQGAYGVYNQLGELLVNPLPFSGQNTLSYFMDRWRPTDPNADYFSTATQWIPGFYPVTGHDGRRTGTNLVQDASYLRLKTLELGYTLPTNMLSKAGIKNLRVYLSGYNLLTFTGLKNVDPERSGPDPTTSGTPYVDFYSYPVNKTYSLGAVIKF